MKCCILLLFLLLVCTSNVYAEEKKPLEFPPEYFKEVGSSDEQVINGIRSDTKVGRKTDKFITKEEYDVNYANVKKGNDSKIVKCPCESGDCSRNCHVNVIINNKTGERQYRYIPVTSENDSQANPYFMMLARQRLIAKTDKEEAGVFKIPEVKAQQVITPPKDPRPNKNRFYTSITLGTSIGGSAKFISKETTGVYNAATGVTASPGESDIENFSLDREYGKSPYFAVAVGVEKPTFGYSALRFDISSAMHSLNSGSNKNISQTRMSGVDAANFNIDKDYGSGHFYNLSFNASFDFLRQVSWIYPSIGAGVGVAYFEFKTPAAAGGVAPMFSLFAHINMDIDSQKTFFVGFRSTILGKGRTFANNYTDRDLNSANTGLTADRLLYDRNIEFSKFSTHGIEAGIRFY